MMIVTNNKGPYYSGYGTYRSGGLKRLTNQVPYVRNSNGGTIIRHKEYIGDIGPSTLFTVDTFPLNPGMDQTFPWLSQIAMAYTQYKWRGLVFTYKTTSSDLVTSTNPSLGTVMMATDYNAAEEPFIDKRAMASYEFTTSSKPSMSFVHGVECEKRQTAESMFYTRDGPPKEGGDIRLYDIGSFSIATQGMQATDPNATIGELWVAYEVEFFKPRFDIDAGLEWDSHRGQTTGITPLALLGTLPISTLAGSNLGTTINYANNDIHVRFPADSSGKSFLVCYYFLSDTAGTGPATSFTGVGNDYCNVIQQRRDTPTTTKSARFDILVQIGNVPNTSNLPILIVTPNPLSNANFPISTITNRPTLNVIEVNNRFRLF